MHRVREYSGHKEQIVKFLVTDKIIFSLAEAGEFIIFNTQTASKISTHKFDPAFDIMMHPVTYVNKILFACSNSEHLELWNVIESDRIYSFNCIKGLGGVHCIEQSPVVDVVAMGCANGSVCLVNLKMDEVLLTFTQKEGPISSVSFLTDTRLGVSLLASTSL